jgi:hypothetical protein
VVGWEVEGVFCGVRGREGGGWMSEGDWSFFL